MSSAEPVSHQALEDSLDTLTETLQFAVPEGATPGQQLQIQHNGQTLMIAVPEGAVPGQMIEIDAPKVAATPLQTVSVQVDEKETARQIINQLQRAELVERFGGLQPETITMRYLILLIIIFYGLMFYAFSYLELAMESDGLANGRSTWLAKWGAIRNTIISCLKLFIYPSAGLLSDQLGRRDMIRYSLGIQAVLAFIFGAFLNTFWFWMLLVPLNAFLDPWPIVAIGAGIKDTIPHIMYNQTDGAQSNEEFLKSSLKSDLQEAKRTGNACCSCCIPRRFTAITAAKLYSIVIGFFVVFGIISVIIISLIFDLFLSNLARNQAVWCTGSFILFCSALYAHFMIPETIDPKERKSATSSLGDFFKGGFREADFVSPWTAMYRLFGPKQTPQVRWLMVMTLFANVVENFTVISNLYFMHRYGFNIISTWAPIFTGWILLGIITQFFALAWFKCFGEKEVKETDAEGRSWEEWNGLGQQNSFVFAGFVGLPLAMWIPWGPVALYWIIPVFALFVTGAAPAIAMSDIRKRLLGYNNVGEYTGYVQTLVVLIGIVTSIPGSLLWTWSVEQNAVAGYDGCPNLAQHPHCEGDDAEDDIKAHLDAYYSSFGNATKNGTALSGMYYKIHFDAWSQGAGNCPHRGLRRNKFYEGSCADTNTGAAVICTVNEDEWGYGTHPDLRWGSSCDWGLPKNCKAAEKAAEQEALGNVVDNVLFDCWKQENCGFQGLFDDTPRCEGVEAHPINTIELVAAVCAWVGYAISLFWVYATRPWKAANANAKQENITWLKREDHDDVVAKVIKGD